MATLSFICKSKNSDSLATIYLRLRSGREIDITVPTYLTVNPKNWSNKTQSYKQRMNTPNFDKEAQEIELREIKEFIAKSLNNLVGLSPTKQWLLGSMKSFEALKQPKNEISDSEENLNQYIERFIAEATSGKRLCNSRNTRVPYSEGTLRSLKDFKRAFFSYQGIDTGGTGKRYKNESRDYMPLNFNDITIDFYNDFLSHYYNKGCGANYIGKLVKILKTVMRSAREEGKHSNEEIERKAFKVLTEDVENIYLTEEELRKLYDLDLEDNNKLRIVRDVFLIGCYTALRYSDYGRISKDNIKEINGVKVVEIIQQKTQNKVVIPLKPEAISILEKYDFTMPKTYEQMINEGVKSIGKLAKIDDVINYEVNKGGLRVKQSVPKYLLIKAHTARRTGCTLMYLAGIKPIDIMKISGHRTEKIFLKYIKISKEETAVSLANHPYFKERNLKVVG